MAESSRRPQGRRDVEMRDRAGAQEGETEGLLGAGAAAARAPSFGASTSLGETKGIIKPEEDAELLKVGGRVFPDKIYFGYGPKEYKKDLDLYRRGDVPEGAEVKFSKKDFDRFCVITTDGSKFLKVLERHLSASKANRVVERERAAENYVEPAAGGQDPKTARAQAEERDSRKFWKGVGEGVTKVGDDLADAAAMAVVRRIVPTSTNPVGMIVGGATTLHQMNRMERALGKVQHGLKRVGDVFQNIPVHWEIKQELGGAIFGLNDAQISIRRRDDTLFGKAEGVIRRATNSRTFTDHVTAVHRFKEAGLWATEGRRNLAKLALKDDDFKDRYQKELAASSGKRHRD